MRSVGILVRFFKDVYQFRDYIRVSAFSKLKADLADFRLGWLWWILEPIIDMLLNLFIYTVVFQRTTKYIVAVILTGLVFWRFFKMFCSQA